MASMEKVKMPGILTSPDLKASELLSHCCGRAIAMGWVADHCPLAPLAQKLSRNGLQVLLSTAITDLEGG